MQTQSLGFAVLIAATLAPMTALAQTTPDVAADRADALASRNVDIGGMADFGGAESLEGAVTGPPPSPHKVSVVFAAPVAYSSNPERVSSNADGDGHVTPTFTAKYEYTTPVSKNVFSFTFGGFMDSNFDRTANDTTAVNAGVGYSAPSLAKALGAAPGVAPYISYGFQDLYQKRFGAHILGTHTGAIGINYKTPDRPKPPEPKPGETPPPPLPPQTKLVWNIEAARREASVVTANLNRFRVSAGFEGGIALDGGAVLGWSVSQKVEYKDYSGGAAKTRDDIALTSTGVLIYPISPTLQARLIAQYEHNGSDVTGKDYDVVDVGVQLRAAF